jgi:hypothetical protein
VESINTSERESTLEKPDSSNIKQKKKIKNKIIIYPFKSPKIQTEKTDY